jgi:hypothetical protein
MKFKKSDIGCNQEHNLDTTQHQVKSQLYATAQRRWQWRKLTVTSTPVQFAKTYKPGGTLMISVNSLSSRLIGMSKDKWGRWTCQTYQGKNNIKISIFSVYQVVDSAAALQGQLTAASQQQALMAATNDTLTKPQQAFCLDLQFTISNDIIIVGDFNEVLGNHQGGINQVAAEWHLVDVMAATHPNLRHPATFMRGRTRIDYVLATPRVMEAVRFAAMKNSNIAFTPITEPTSWISTPPPCSELRCKN